MGGGGAEYTYEAPPQGKAKVVLYRNGSFFGHGSYELVQLNGEELTTVTNGGWFDTNVDPGKLSIATKPRVQFIGLGSLIMKNWYDYEPVLVLETTPNQIYFVRFESPGVFSGKQRFDTVLVEESEARKELEGKKRFGEGEEFYY